MKRSSLALLLATGLAALVQPAFVHSALAHAATKQAPAKAQPAAAVAAPAAAEFPTDKLLRADGARVVPDRFLRAWDPVTVFFDADTGPSAGGAEDNPERFVTMSPKTAGEWRWIGARALQFRPADPWKALQRVEVKTKDARAKLVALLPAPESTSPAEGADPVTDLDQIALTFAEPVDMAALSRLITIELRKAPGVSPQGAQALAARDFDIRPLERAKRDDKQTYVVRFKSSIPDGRVAVLRLKLSDEPGLDDPIFELRARTAAPFAISDADCGRGWSGSKRDDVLQCASLGADSDAGADEGQPSYQAAPKRRLTLSFSATPEKLDILRAREALRITPAVDDLAVEPDGSRLKITARFLSDRVYEIAVAESALSDERKRPLAESYAQKFSFAADKPSIAWDAGAGIVERLGPQFLPLRGRGYDRADVRIHAIDPLSRDFWPFPGDGVETEDASAAAAAGQGAARLEGCGQCGSRRHRRTHQGVGFAGRLDADGSADPPWRRRRQIRPRYESAVREDRRREPARRLPRRPASDGWNEASLAARAGDRSVACRDRRTEERALRRHLVVERRAGRRRASTA